MRFPFLLLFLSSLLYGGAIPLHLTFSSQPTVTIRILNSIFNTMGYRLDTDTLRIQNDSGELTGTLIANKPLVMTALAEALREQEIRIQKGELNSQGLNLDLDTHNAKWNLPVIAQDAGAELKRVNTPQWFRVEEARHIRIVSPYEGKWYPEIAVLNTNMDVLYSFRSIESKEEIEFDLPAESFYLKVSNVQGMKVMKEGMWIESLNIGR